MPRTSQKIEIPRRVQRLVNVCAYCSDMMGISVVDPGGTEIAVSHGICPCCYEREMAALDRMGLGRLAQR
jgi:hypothetical protein